MFTVKMKRRVTIFPDMTENETPIKRERDLSQPPEKMYLDDYNSPLGKIIMASDGDALTGLWFENQKYFSLSPGAEIPFSGLSIFDETARWLDVYFSGKAPDFTPTLRPAGTEFRQSVWDILLMIPYGETMTYGEIADRIARQKGLKRMSAQAVGGAVGHNPVSIIIPCHRVIGANGSLTGYAGGIERKRKLLAMEGALSQCILSC